MYSLSKKLKNAANDAHVNTRAKKVVTLVSATQNQQYMFRASVVVLLASIATLSALSFWDTQQKRETAVAVTTALEKPVEPKIKVKLVQDDKPRPVDVRLGKSALPIPMSSLLPPEKNIAHDDQGIVLNADSASALVDDTVAPAPQSDPRVAVVVEEIRPDIIGLPTKHNAKHENILPRVQFNSRQPMTIDELLTTAHDLLMQGEDVEALGLYDQVLKRDKNNRSALQAKMYVLQHKGDSEQAVDIGRRLVQLDPDNTQARANLVAALGRSYKATAMTELEQHVAAKPKDAAALAALAKLESRRGYFDKAYNHLKRAVEVAPQNLGYRLDLAILYDRAGYGADALTLYRHVLRAALNEDAATRSAFPTESVRQRVAYLEHIVTTASADPQ